MKNLNLTAQTALGRHFAWALPVLASALLLGCATVADGTAGGELAQSQVQITRTTHGIPHVKAVNPEMLAYGIAYAHAQDNVCLSADHMQTLRGQRSVHFGASATGVLGVRTLLNPVIDTFVQAHMDDAKLAGIWSGASPSAKAMATGYVQGYNRYLADNASNLPGSEKLWNRSIEMKPSIFSSCGPSLAPISR